MDKQELIENLINNGRITPEEASRIAELDVEEIFRAYPTILGSDFFGKSKPLKGPFVRWTSKMDDEFDNFIERATHALLGPPIEVVGGYPPYPPEAPDEVDGLKCYACQTLFKNEKEVWADSDEDVFVCTSCKDKVMAEYPDSHYVPGEDFVFMADDGRIYER